MSPDPWLPRGFALTSAVTAGRLLAAGDEWQLVETSVGGRVLLARTALSDRWAAVGLVDAGTQIPVAFGPLDVQALLSGPDHVLAPLDRCRSPSNMDEALAFATALRETRRAAGAVNLQDGIYVEAISRILPTYGPAPEADDALVLGTWLTGGLRVPVAPLGRIQALLTWLPPEALAGIVEAAGMKPEGIVPLRDGTDRSAGGRVDGTLAPAASGATFKLPGRAVLERFFNEHVVDLVQNPEHYKALGIGNPPAIILEGPPGCGKTVAVEKLVAFLGWPLFTVEASSVASPYIHETSRKVAQLFRSAIEAAPSAVVIDEMDAFLSERDSTGSGQHRVEEVAEFLRLIPEAVRAGVVVIGMTNRIDAVDPAILRRGRFDHVVRVDFADREEMLDFLGTLLEAVPLAAGVDLRSYAASLAGRPLSDAAFLIREGARLAAKARKGMIDEYCLDEAMRAVASRGGSGQSNRIGFI